MTKLLATLLLGSLIAAASGIGLGPTLVRAVFADGISSPAGVAIGPDGSVYISSYSGNYIERVAPDGTRKRTVEGLATPTGIAFGRDGRLLVANRSSGELLSVDVVSGDRKVVGRSLSLPVGAVEMADGGLVATQYGGRLTRVLPDGKTQELGASFVRPGVGIVADGADAVLAIDNGAGLVRQLLSLMAKHNVVTLS